MTDEKRELNLAQITIGTMEKLLLAAVRDLYMSVLGDRCQSAKDLHAILDSPRPGDWVFIRFHQCQYDRDTWGRLVAIRDEVIPHEDELGSWAWLFWLMTLGGEACGAYGTC